MSIGKSLLRDLCQPYIYHTHLLYLFMLSWVTCQGKALHSVFALKLVCKDAILNLKKVVLRVLLLPSDSGAPYLSAF